MKTVEIGYQLPHKLLPFNISNVRFYLSGYNLFTWTNYSLYQQDPEVAYKPQQEILISTSV